MIDMDKIAKEMEASYEKSDVTMFSKEMALPDRDEVIKILTDIRKLFFPAYFGAAELAKGEEKFVSDMLISIYEKVKRQVSLALSFGNKQKRKR